MRDAYKEAMDAVKAPDALVEKTLKSMLEEREKLSIKKEADAELRVRKTPPKARWVAQIAVPVAACLLLIAIVPRVIQRETDSDGTPADHRYSPSPGTSTALSQSPSPETPAAFVQSPSPETPTALSQSPSPEAPTPTGNSAEEISESIAEALAKENLATRSGPGGDYRETGTYPLKGELVRLFSQAYDEDGNCWVQCDMPAGDKLRRVYTGLQRFDAATFDLGGVREEIPLDDHAKMVATVHAMYGPGEGYDAYAELTVDKGQTVIIIAIEEDYAQVEWKTSKQLYRAWVPTDSLE